MLILSVAWCIVVVNFILDLGCFVANHIAVVARHEDDFLVPQKIYVKSGNRVSTVPIDLVAEIWTRYRRTYDQVGFIWEELVREIWLIYVDSVDDGNEVQIVQLRQRGKVAAPFSGPGSLVSLSGGEPLVPGLAAGKVAGEHAGGMFVGRHEYGSHLPQRRIAR
jgi:hypothetical protein